MAKQGKEQPIQRKTDRGGKDFDLGNVHIYNIEEEDKP